MKTNMFSWAALWSLLLLSSCGEEITYVKVPFVNHFTPASGKAGDTVIVTGFNFSLQAAGNTVKFTDNTIATVIDASFTRITVVVPAGATTGKIAVTANGLTGTSTDDFIVAAIPVPTVTITAFAPATGVPGDEVTITGSGFSTDITQNKVRFANDVAATVTAATATELKVTVPAGAVTGKISVTAGTATGTSASDFTVPVIPTFSITSFSPVMGAFGQEVTITGTGFSTDMSQNIVRFNNPSITATVTAATATELKVAVPFGAITGPVSVTVGTQSATSTAIFEVLIDLPRNGLLAFYPLSGNGNDASGHGNHLAAYGTTTLTTDRFGMADHAYSFVGGNSYLTNTNTGGVQISHPLTIGLWLKYDSLIGSSLVGKYNGGNGFILGATGDGKLTFVLDGTVNIVSNSYHLTSNSNGQWVWIGVTYDGSSLRIYRNGTLRETITQSGSINATMASMRIGPDGYGDPTSPHAFKCMIDDVTIYNRVLSDMEMLQLSSQNVTKQ
jgi:hypothetical protein